ncbi:hypothetical protein [Mycobacterium sp. URHB0044]|jgi:hypothetical protein|uniref:hypothetical protein n=1 Tax=Mycobacterium sp. URHB0044 TaxID=1380386 RepID=UPI00056B92D8|nr:hypothetical protein [Mycobacterium sp. URHB0044]
MSSSFVQSTRRLALATAAGAALLTIALPSALAAPATDGQGFVDSTARCTTPDTAVAFGSTATSRVAICKSPGGAYEYRGVRVRDGAKLILSASQKGDGGYVAENDGITYTVTATSLLVSVGQHGIRDEAWVDYHGPASTTSPTTSSTSTSTPTTSTAKPTTTTPTTPLPPPLPAEQGGGG